MRSEKEEQKEITKKQKEIIKKAKKIKKFKKKQPRLELNILKESQKEELRKMEFDKEILHNPNSSENWIKKISFLAETEKIEKVREETERGLLVINFNDEKEKLNLWKCYMNLEFYFGDDEKLLKVFQRALNSNKREDIIGHLVNLYVQNKKFEKAEDIVKLYLKKSNDKKNSWLKYIDFLINWRFFFKKAENEKNVEILEKKIKMIIKRALQSLDKRDHVFFLSQYSILEYKFENYEIARMNLENILVNFPKRTDIWNVYLDMEIKYTKNQKYIRDLFNKFILLPHKIKKAKKIFKKYLNYEIVNGNTKTQNFVKEKAQSYVSKIMENNN